MQIKQALKWGNETLLLTSESARLDAEVLMAYVLKKPAVFLMTHDNEEVGFFDMWKYKRLISKRKKGMPVTYLTGHKEFFFLDFDINRHVLVPRPDTETLVECVINYLHNSKLSTPNSQLILLDIGTGSACIPISILKNIEDVRAIATDISENALKVAKKNIKKHKLQSRIQLIKSDLLKDVPLDSFIDKEVILTANMPYIPKDYQVNPELKYEPQISLYGGDDGMDIYKKLVDQIQDIKPIAIFFELFDDQIAILKTRLPDYRLKYVKNMSGVARALVMERVVEG